MARKARKKGKSKKRKSRKSLQTIAKGRSKYVTRSEFKQFANAVDHRFDRVEGYVVKIVDVLRKHSGVAPIKTMRDTPAKALPAKVHY